MFDFRFQENKYFIVPLIFMAMWVSAYIQWEFAPAPYLTRINCTTKTYFVSYLRINLIESELKTPLLNKRVCILYVKAMHIKKIQTCYLFYI